VEANITYHDSSGRNRQTNNTSCDTPTGLEEHDGPLYLSTNVLFCKATNNMLPPKSLTRLKVLRTDQGASSGGHKHNYRRYSDSKVAVRPGHNHEYTYSKPVISIAILPSSAFTPPQYGFTCRQYLCIAKSGSYMRGLHRITRHSISA